MYTLIAILTKNKHLQKGDNSHKAWKSSRTAGLGRWVADEERKRSYSHKYGDIHSVWVPLNNACQVSSLKHLIWESPNSKMYMDKNARGILSSHISIWHQPQGFDWKQWLKISENTISKSE